ncbi:MAG TPA: LTA synthase family protein, partial [Planctomycetota bacterium]|nr:LTA synthase family protein [Planctomycetota bacterium]
LARDLPPPIQFGVQIAVAAVALVLMYYGERGTLGGKRLRMVTAFQRLPHPAAHLALNGPYCVLHSLVHARPVKTEFYPWPDALQTTRETLFISNDRTSDPEYPLLRTPVHPPLNRWNVVVIMLESWNAVSVDAQRREMGLPPLGITPSYDAISREGRLFTRFYANGQRSMDGMSAILCGFPTLPGTSYLGRGLEQSSLTTLGSLGRHAGYETWFIQSSERDSFRCDAIAPRLGFDHYLGAEDIPPEPPAAPRGVLRGACWDHEMFAEANRKLTAATRPFLAFLYTNSTHPPFFWPEERWKKRSGDTIEDRYLNSLGYGDWALGKFFEGAKAAGWFRNTIFIVTADHVGGPGDATNGSPAAKHHIPFLLLAPGLEPGIERRIGSQLDVIPTLADLLGELNPQAALGSSLLSPRRDRGALCVEGNLVLRVEDCGWVLHDLSGRVAASDDDTEMIERRLLSVVQVAYTLLRTNRISKP